jgi:hypothetical protein
MLSVKKSILDRTVEDLIDPICVYLKTSWEIPENIYGYRCRFGDDFLKSIVFDMYIQGWTSGLGEYSLETAEMVALELKKLSGESASQLSIFKDDGVLNSLDMDGRIEKARKIDRLSKVMRDIHNQILISSKRSVSNKSAQMVDTLIKKYKNLSRLKPKKLKESIDQITDGGTLKEKLRSDNWAKLIDEFSGYDVLMNNCVRLPELLSSPVVAWELSYNSKSIIEQLSSAVYAYAFELRKHHNHYLVELMINNDDSDSVELGL